MRNSFWKLQLAVSQVLSLCMSLGYSAAAQAQNSPEVQPDTSKDPAAPPEEEAPPEQEAPPREETQPIEEEESSSSDAPPKKGLELPVFLTGPVPVYPTIDGDVPETVSVILQLSLDVDGNVTAVEVIESAGGPFDDEARRVAQLYKFTPARNQGVAIAARIRTRVEFLRPPEPQVKVEPSPVVPLAPVVAVPPENDVDSVPSTPPDEEVLVFGEQDEEERLAQSADSVTVVDLTKAKQSSSDMGEVLARTPGLVIRRSGGVGSDVRVSLNGLYDRSVRQFVDSVPLWMTAFPDNVGALPVNLFDHIEVYRGVVPLRLAADALGGAINFVTDKTYENHATASFQVGSFGTYRGTGLVQYRHEPTNFVARVVGYADDVENDYKVDVEVPDASGRLSAVTVPLFHKAYSAYGAVLEAGFVDKPWTERFLVRGFVAGTNTEIQHNQVMSVPYGEPWWNDDSAGAAIIYDQDFGHGVRLDTTTNYSHRYVHLQDLGAYVYNWYGERGRERRTNGEITDEPLDKTVWRNAVFHRSMAEWEVTPEHVLLASLTPLFAAQTGKDLTWTSDLPDPLAAKNTMINMVSGVGYELNVIPMPHAPKDPQMRRRGTDFRLQNTFNVKSYLYRIASSEALPAGGERTHRVDSHALGIGDGVRFAFTKWLFLKGSYEYSRRLPDPFEIFGDGALVSANLELVPEVSHNANLGPLLDWKGTQAGDFVVMANVAYRASSDMIVLLGNLQYLTYRNVYRAETWSGEGGVSWMSPGKYLSLDWSGTLNDSRNRSESGPFAEFNGDQIPNRSPFSTSWSARLSFQNVIFSRDRIEPFYQGRYTEGFYRSWESQGITEFKDKVDNQTAHDAGISYVNQWSHGRLTNTFEVQNFTDANLFDDFGVQRPGRAFYWKVTGEAF